MDSRAHSIKVKSACQDYNRQPFVLYLREVVGIYRRFSSFDTLFSATECLEHTTDSLLYDAVFILMNEGVDFFSFLVQHSSHCMNVPILDAILIRVSVYVYFSLHVIVIRIIFLVNIYFKIGSMLSLREE